MLFLCSEFTVSVCGLPLRFMMSVRVEEEQDKAESAMSSSLSKADPLTFNNEPGSAEKK